MLAPALGDRVAQEQEVDVLGLRAVEERPVELHPPLGVAAGVGRGGRPGRLLRRQGRREAEGQGQGREDDRSGSHPGGLLERFGVEGPRLLRGRGGCQGFALAERPGPAEVFEVGDLLQGESAGESAVRPRGRVAQGDQGADAVVVGDAERGADLFGLEPFHRGRSQAQGLGGDHQRGGREHGRPRGPDRAIGHVLHRSRGHRFHPPRPVLGDRAQLHARSEHGVQVGPMRDQIPQDDHHHRGLADLRLAVRRRGQALAIGPRPHHHEPPGLEVEARRRVGRELQRRRQQRVVDRPIGVEMPDSPATEDGILGGHRGVLVRVRGSSADRTILTGPGPRTDLTIRARCRTVLTSPRDPSPHPEPFMIAPSRDGRPFRIPTLLPLVLACVGASRPDDGGPTARPARLSALQSIAARIAEEPGPKAGEPDDERTSPAEALLEVAASQTALGDTDAARATLVRAERSLESPSVARILAGIATRARIAEAWSEAGDRAEARAVLDRATAAIASLDRPEHAAGLRKLAGAETAGESLAGDLSGLMIADLTRMVIEGRIVLGDLEEARRLIHRSLDRMKGVTGDSKPMLLGVFGGLLARAGDPDGGREIVRQALAQGESLPAPDRTRARLFLAGAMARAGQIEEAVALAASQPERTRERSLIAVIDEFQEIDPDESSGWLDPAGIKVLIGRQGTRPRGSIDDLVRLSRAVQAMEDSPAKARGLAIVATLLARAERFSSAMEAAGAIPTLARKDGDRPHPADGFDEAVKPSVLAMVASRMALSGDKAGAAAGMDRASALIPTVATPGQRLVASLVLARAHLDAKDPLSALNVARETADLALSQPEPLRSRALVMLARVRIGAGDAPGAIALAESTRTYPGVERGEILVELAQALRKRGDEATAKALARLALDCGTVPKPEGFRLGPTLQINAFGRDTYIDPSLEFPEGHAKFSHDRIAERARNLIGDTAAAERAAGQLPAVRRPGVLGGRGLALGQVAADLALKGETDEALRVASTIESASDRLWAYQQMARMCREVAAR